MILSPDTDFAPRGNVTEVNYLESFWEYKKILSTDPSVPTYQRIFTIFNTSLFGMTATPRAYFILDTGDYDAELREFNEWLAAEKRGDTETVDLSPPSPPAPSSPPESHISVSVTSNISLVTAAVNVVTSNITLVPTDENIETLPLAMNVTKALSGTWYFSNFFFLIFITFSLVLFPPCSFLSVSPFKKRQYACY